MDYSNPIIYAVPIFIGFILVEFGTSSFLGNKRLYKLKDLKASVLLGLGTLISASLLKVIYVVVVFMAIYELFNPIVDGVRTNILGYQSFSYAWYVWIICQFLDDFTFYWYHRLSHTVRLFWAAHIPHHSSHYYNYGTGLRIGWFVMLYKPLFYFWLPAIGFHYEMVIVCMGIETLYQFQLHTQYIPKLGFLEKIFVTHTQHQVHHSRAIPHLDKNHGGILCIFDKLFGTYYGYDEKSKVDFGVLHPPNSYNPLIIVSHEFKSIWQDVKKSKSFKEALMYIFGPPGWSNDDSRKTSKELQLEYYTAK